MPTLNWSSIPRFFPSVTPLRRITQLTALSAVLTLSAHAQFWVRESTVLPESISGGGNHNGSKGSLSFTTSVYGGLEFNDNVTLSSSGESGLALRTGITTGMHYPVSEKNELTFDASLERLTYISGVSGSEDYNSILPGTTTTFTVFIGPVRVRNFLQIDLTEDPVASPVINNTARFGRFNALAGTQVDWDMNKVIWQFTASVGRQFATEAVNDQIDLWRYAVGLRTVFPVGPGTAWGLSTSYAITRYDEKIQNNSTTRTAGTFGRIALGRNMSLEATAGLQWVDYDSSGSITDTDDYNGVYGSLAFSHQLRRTVSYTVTLRHDIDEGYGTNFYRITELSLSTTLKMMNKWDLVGNAGWQWIDESGTGEQAKRLNLGLEARRPLGRKLDGAIGVSHVEKFSDQPGKDYTQNRAYFSLRYTF